MTVYKPMTPTLRRSINKTCEKKISELNECENTCYVQMLKHLYETERTLLTALPDGYLIPFEDIGDADNETD